MSWLDKYFTGVTQVQGAGVSQPQAPILNFTNATVTTNPATGVTSVTTAGGGGGGSATLASSFTMPAVGSTVVSAMTTGGGAAFQKNNAVNVNVSGAPSNFTVTIVSGDNVTLLNNGGPFNVAPAGTVPAASIVTVASTNAPIGASVPGVGQALALQPSGSYGPQAHPFVWNVKTATAGGPGALGDGITDDTAAVQRALNIFSGKSSTVSGTLYFPKGTYLITSSLTFIGNTSNSIHIVGEVAGLSAGIGAWIQWGGPSNVDMFIPLGMCESKIINLGFNGTKTARSGIRFRSDQVGAPGGESGGSPCNGVLVDKCYFSSFVSGQQWVKSTGYSALAVVNPIAASTLFYYITLAGGTSASSPPTWSTSRHTAGSANVTTDGSVTWLTVDAWFYNTAYLANEYVADHSFAGRTVVKCTTPGTSGAQQPVFNQTVGGTTNDGTAVWTTIAVGVNCITAATSPIGQFYGPLQGSVILGDVQDTHQVSTITFKDCTFGGVFGPGGTFAHVNYPSGGNSEQFKFDNCSFSAMENALFAGYQANNGLTFEFCQFGEFIGYCVWLAANNVATLLMHNCLAEGGAGGAGTVYFGLGAWANLNGQTKAIISGGEATIDCSNMPFNAIISANGQTTVQNMNMNPDGAQGAAAATPYNVGTIRVTNANLAGSPGAGFSSLTVREVTWNNATEQIPIVDSGGNNLSLTTSTNIGASASYNIRMYGNVGFDQQGGTGTIQLPSFSGQNQTLFGTGCLVDSISPLILIKSLNQPRSTTSVFRIPFTLLNTTANTVFLYGRIFIPPFSKVQEVLANCTVGFTGGVISNVTVSVGDALSGSVTSFLKATSVFAPTTWPVGTAVADLGVNLTSDPQFIQGGWYCRSAGLQSVYVNFIATGANLTALTAGSLDLTITMENLRVS